MIVDFEFSYFSFLAIFGSLFLLYCSLLNHFDMSKGKLLRAKSSGSLGDVTMYVRLGVPVQRARNRHPRNPQTDKQQANRRRMAIVLKEWHRVKAENIPLNFDQRKSNQSIYSAFIALNLPLVNVDCPELTPWRYSLI